MTASNGMAGPKVIRAVASQMPQRTLRGVVGGKMIIACNISPPSSDDAISLILWYKDESTVPIYR